MFSALLSLESFSFDNSKKISNKQILKFNESINFYENEEREECTLSQCKTNNKNNLSNNVFK